MCANPSEFSIMELFSSLSILLRTKTTRKLIRFLGVSGAKIHELQYFRSIQATHCISRCTRPACCARRSAAAPRRPLSRERALLHGNTSHADSNTSCVRTRRCELARQRRRPHQSRCGCEGWEKEGRNRNIFVFCQRVPGRQPELSDSAPGQQRALRQNMLIYLATSR